MILRVSEEIGVFQNWFWRVSDMIDVNQMRFVLQNIQDQSGLDENDIDELIQEVDKNEDGFIDYEEFQSMITL